MTRPNATPRVAKHTAANGDFKVMTAFPTLDQ